jgi:hypothetical protein
MLELYEILALAEGKSILNPNTEREGLVWVRGSGDDRISFKTISNRFLAKGEDERIKTWFIPLQWPFYV